MIAAVRIALASPARRTPRTAVRVIVVFVVVLIAAALHWWYGNRHGFSDLRIYYGAVRFWAHGQSLYDFSQPDRVQDQLGFTYPPFAALVMFPMAWLSWNVTVSVMLLVSLAAIGLTTVWLLVPVADRYGWPRWFVVCLALPLTSWLEPIRRRSHSVRSTCCSPCSSWPTCWCWHPAVRG